MIIKAEPTAAMFAAQVNLDREAIEYQAAVQALAQHIGRDHNQYVMALAGTAQTYHLHLIAKLAESTDPTFNDQREAARALCYWTLAGKLGIEDQKVIHPPSTKPIPQA